MLESDLNAPFRREIFALSVKSLTVPILRRI
jgi:hypothetical protein